MPKVSLTLLDPDDVAAAERVITDATAELPATIAAAAMMTGAFKTMRGTQVPSDHEIRDFLIYVARYMTRGLIH